ncbi:serine hydrolase family protein [Rhodococcus sp. 14C212]|uniref:alpha/beta fold hydrolase n=1 Tax=Rhodococcus sp. 14C212 TaxID=2711209 RepID=UPI0013EA3C3E|nr:serine hydrolase family protein [Rhodococcus sp. 14C212]
MNITNCPTVVIVPGLAPLATDHWQHQLAQQLPQVCTVERPTGTPLDRAGWVAALEKTLSDITGPVVVVAHSAGVLTTVHWAREATRPVHGALLVTPPDFELPLPDGYPSVDELTRYGWNPIPRRRLPFRSIVAASSDDPLACPRRVAGMAEMWGSRLVDLGDVGHLTPASGYGYWPQAEDLLQDLIARVPTGAAVRR